jgi:hypothetical protein
MMAAWAATLLTAKTPTARSRDNRAIAGDEVSPVIDGIGVSYCLER